MNIVPVASLIFLWLSFSVAERTISVDDLVGVVSASPAELANISLRLYTGKTIDEYASVPVDHAADLVGRIDPTKPTVFYIFGWKQSPREGSTTPVIDAYLKRGDHNVILINWQHIAASAVYPFVAASASKVGDTLAKAINEMVTSGLNPSTIHIVGHSLGSQIAGFIGRNVNFTVPRITGLDPAGPGYYVLVESLTSSAAEFVDVIHTDAGVLGTASAKVSVNFYPNAGTRIQPGCGEIGAMLNGHVSCSHSRAWEFYAESLQKEDAFIGRACDSYVLYMAGLCSSKAKVVMGYATPTTARGSFYLQTNSQPPYGKEDKGA